MKIKCAHCGKVREIQEFSLENYYNDINIPTKSGAREYFKLWHFPLQICFNCNYSAIDISNATKLEKTIISSREYQEIFNDELLQNLQNVGNSDLPNQVAYAYLMDKTENYLEAGRAYLCASDFAYSQFIRWIIMEDESGDDNISVNDKILRLSLEKYCDRLFEKAVYNLKKAYNKDKTIESEILLIGALLSGDESEKEIAKQLIDKLEMRNLSKDELAICNYFKQIYNRKKA